MSNFAVIACALGLLAFAGCTVDSEQTAPEAVATSRTISQELRASCPEMPAPRIPTARLAADPMLVIDTAKGYTFVDSIYDVSGALIGAGRVEMYLDSADIDGTDDRPVFILWNGMDSAGRPVEDGNYFLFYRFLDEVGRVSRIDSTCIGYIRGAGN